VARVHHTLRRVALLGEFVLRSAHLRLIAGQKWASIRAVWLTREINLLRVPHTLYIGDVGENVGARHVQRNMHVRTGGRSSLHAWRHLSLRHASLHLSGRHAWRHLSRRHSSLHLSRRHSSLRHLSLVHVSLSLRHLSLRHAPAIPEKIHASHASLRPAHSAHLRASLRAPKHHRAASSRRSLPLPRIESAQIRWRTNELASNKHEVVGGERLAASGALERNLSSNRQTSLDR